VKNDYRTEEEARALNGQEEPFKIIVLYAVCAIAT
jgi:hypothetical protein